MTPRCRRTPNPRWNNIVYINFGIFSDQQSRLNIAYFNVDLKRVTQRRNNIVIFNVDFHNAE